MAGCERVLDPLVCNLTTSLSEPDQVYFIKVTALLEDQVLGSEYQRFYPIRDSKWPSWAETGSKGMFSVALFIERRDDAN